MGHTKSYTKVVLEPTKEVIGNQPAEALLGKCVKIMVTETQKWHITGYIIDANPTLEEAPADYFEKLEKRRYEETLREQKAEEEQERK